MGTQPYTSLTLVWYFYYTFSLYNIWGRLTWFPAQEPILQAPVQWGSAGSCSRWTARWTPPSPWACWCWHKTWNWPLTGMGKTGRMGWGACRREGWERHSAHVRRRSVGSPALEWPVKWHRSAERFDGRSGWERKRTTVLFERSSLGKVRRATNTRMSESTWVF